MGISIHIYKYVYPCEYVWMCVRMRVHACVFYELICVCIFLCMHSYIYMQPSVSGEAPVSPGRWLPSPPPGPSPSPSR